MSITDELRRWVGIYEHEVDYMLTSRQATQLREIADCIDAEYQKAIWELNNLADASVLLPVDADGVPIHIGDRVENNERVVRIVLTDDSWEPSVYVEKLPNVLHEYFCHEVSHCQPDSWERIIADATAYRVHDKAPCSISELVERCKRLAGEA